MAFEIEFHSDAPPGVALEAIRVDAAYWRESQIPLELRVSGTFGVSTEVSKERFRIYREDWNDLPRVSCDLRGRVELAAHGGSRIVARIGLTHGWFVAPAIFATLGLWVMASDHTGAIVLWALAAIVGIFEYLADQRISPADATARHLVDRLQMVMTKLSAVRSSAQSPDAV